MARKNKIINNQETEVTIPSMLTDISKAAAQCRDVFNSCEQELKSIDNVYRLDAKNNTMDYSIEDIDQLVSAKTKLRNTQLAAITQQTNLLKIKASLGRMSKIVEETSPTMETNATISMDDIENVTRLVKETVTNINDKSAFKTQDDE